MVKAWRGTAPPFIKVGGGATAPAAPPPGSRAPEPTHSNVVKESHASGIIAFMSFISQIKVTAKLWRELCLVKSYPIFKILNRWKEN